ncbi:MAG: DUF1684 domain-containing protein [Caldilineaceae bacterium]|nr:DUF1684 domain-containing protein [Caldilineaceae bacterium]
MSQAYIAQIEAWRAAREAELRSPDSWFSLVGLFILHDGYHTLGSSAENDIVLPASAPSQLGILEFRDGQAKLNITTSASVLVDGAPAQTVTLVDNQNRQTPTLVTTGTVTFFLHSFGDQYAIRVKDSSSPAIAAFAGCEWFPVKPEYRAKGHFTRHDAPRAIPIKTIVDTNSKYQSVGTLEFELLGQSLTLLATDYGVPHQLSVVLRDATAGKETYGPARFLTVELADDDSVVIDFNKAFNPPCAFSSYATCPLPPRENILPVAIAAGERYGASGGSPHMIDEPALALPVA